MNENERVNTKHVAPEWVDTPSSQEIYAALRHAQTKPTIALIHGGSGIGKTLTARRYAKENKSKYGRQTVYLVTAQPCISTVPAILAAINMEMDGMSGVDVHGHGCRSDYLARSIAHRLRPGDLVIIDEAQNLDNKALDQVRVFRDEVGIGIAYLSNNEVFTRIHGRSKQAEVLSRISSRMGMDLSIPYSTEEDVKAYMHAWCIDGEKEYDYGCSVAQDQGKGLRGLGYVIENAVFFSETRGGVLNVSMMRAAAANLGYI